MLNFSYILQVIWVCMYLISWTERAFLQVSGTQLFIISAPSQDTFHQEAGLNRELRLKSRYLIRDLDISRVS